MRSKRGRKTKLSLTILHCLKGYKSAIGWDVLIPEMSRAGHSVGVRNRRGNLPKQHQIVWSSCLFVCLKTSCQRSKKQICSFKKLISTNCSDQWHHWCVPLISQRFLSTPKDSIIRPNLLVFQPVLFQEICQGEKGLGKT